MAAKGWTAPTWPEAYGGGGLTKAEGSVFYEEMKRLELPLPLVGMGLYMLGPVLLEHGTEAQKRTHLTAIAQGRIRFCQCYSEPSAGSDLASLRTRAVQAGEDLVVTGQKIWTSYADVSDWCFCLVRTNPDVKKQIGISFVLMDLRSPGVETRRIELISGASPFCEIFFDQVHVPVANVIGGIDAGWTVAKSVLRHERSSIGTSVSEQMRDLEDDLVGKARGAAGIEAGIVPDPAARDQIARLTMRAQAFSLTAQRLARGNPGPESSIFKVVGTELKQDRWELATRLLGPDGLGWRGDDFHEDDLSATRNWLRTRANTLEGGTTEIQLNIIARHVLGLK
jgi:acyl-CoA dehydrogenase